MEYKHRILLDTQCWLWLLSSPEKFSASTLDKVSNQTTELFLSAASAWEIAIKYRLGKLKLPQPPTEYIPVQLNVSGVKLLDILLEHVLGVSSLPDHHYDPFDRLLIVQAKIESLTILTSDSEFKRYGIHTLKP